MVGDGITSVTDLQVTGIGTGTSDDGEEKDNFH